jgi:hypothetical protein
MVAPAVVQGRLGSPAPPAGAEGRFLLKGVPWWTYVALRDALDDTAVRMTYLEGELELMSPSDLHEESKKLIARLIEAWADEKNVDLRGFGSTTFRREATARGLEPDECYVLGKRESRDAAPHIAIEVVVGTPLLDKLAVYVGLGAVEAALEVHRLAGAAYERRARSEVVPGLDLASLSRFVQPGESHTALVKAFRATIR